MMSTNKPRPVPDPVPLDLSDFADDFRSWRTNSDQMMVEAAGVELTYHDPVIIALFSSLPLITPNFTPDGIVSHASLNLITILFVGLWTLAKTANIAKKVTIISYTTTTLGRSC